MFREGHLSPWFWSLKPHKKQTTVSQDIGHKSIYRTNKCNRLTNEKALLKHTYMSGWRTKEQVTARIPSYVFHYSIDPHQIMLFKTFLHSVHTFNGNHCSCPQSSGLTGKTASSWLYWEGIPFWYRLLPQTTLLRYTCRNKKTSEYQKMKLSSSDPSLNSLNTPHPCYI